MSKRLSKLFEKFVAEGGEMELHMANVDATFSCFFLLMKIGERKKLISNILLISNFGDK